MAFFADVLGSPLISKPVCLKEAMALKLPQADSVKTCLDPLGGPGVIHSQPIAIGGGQCNMISKLT